MKKFTAERNARIKRAFEKEMREKKLDGIPAGEAMNDILDRFVIRYSAFELSRESIRQMCTNPNYGRPREYIVVYKTADTKEGENYVLLDDAGKVFVSKKSGKAFKDGKKMLKARGVKARDIRSILIPEDPELEQLLAAVVPQTEDATVTDEAAEEPTPESTHA